MNEHPTHTLPAGLRESIQRASLKFHYKGVRCEKTPFDLALYSLLLWKLKPATIVELGTNTGGFALWLADTSAAMGFDTVIHTVDVRPVCKAVHPRIQAVLGDALALEQVWPHEVMQTWKRPWLVVEDSGHRPEVAQAALTHLTPRMKQGDYLVVEDGALDADGAGGIAGVIAELTAGAKPAFAVDRAMCDYFGPNVTANPDGWLRRV